MPLASIFPLSVFDSKASVALFSEHYRWSEPFLHFQFYALSEAARDQLRDGLSRSESLQEALVGVGEL